MKQIAFEQLSQEIAGLIASAQGERVVITRNGEPYALLVGVENKDAEDLELEFSPAFWTMIEKNRRSTHSVPMKDVLAELEVEEQSCTEQKAGAAPVQCDVPGNM